MFELHALLPKPPPLRTDADGVVRVGRTRVTIDSVVAAYARGNSPEEIVLKFPSLDLTDVYACITYYLWHRAEVDAYLADNRRVTGALQVQPGVDAAESGIRQQLLDRRPASP